MIKLLFDVTFFSACASVSGMGFKTGAPDHHGGRLHGSVTSTLIQDIQPQHMDDFSSACVACVQDLVLSVSMVNGMNALFTAGNSRWKSLLCFLLGSTILLSLLCIYYPTIVYYVHKSNSKSLPSDPVHFVGREREVHEVIQYLDYEKSTSARIVNIFGSPGFGKSTLAIYVGHRMLEKGINVHYINLVDCQREGIKPFLAEKLAGNSNELGAVTFDKFLQWVRGRNFYDLIILDNCDEILHHQKEELQYAVMKVIEKSVNFKFLITSREVTIYTDNFESYKIYELSKKAACDMLESIIPDGMKASLSEREDLAELTGSVPLALRIIGSLLRLHLPNLASPVAVIAELKKEPISTLSPYQLPENNTISASFNLSYRYLNLRESLVGQLLSNFPGSFNMEACIAVLKNTSFMLEDSLEETVIESAVKMLAQRSLLEYSCDDDRYHFHSLIRDYFLAKQRESKNNQATWFLFGFQTYFFELLRLASGMYTGQSYGRALTIIDKERHNFILAFRSWSRKYDFLTIKTIIKAMEVKLLTSRFTYEYLLPIFQGILTFFEEKPVSYNFKGVYLRLIYHVVDLQNKVNSSKAAIEMFEKYEELPVLSKDIHILSLVGKLYSNLGLHAKAKHYYSYITELTCECHHQCTYYILGKCKELSGDYEKAAYYFNLSLHAESSDRSVYEKLVTLFKLHYSYLKLQQPQNAKNTLEQIYPLLPDLVAMPPYELFQNMEDIFSMVARLRHYGKSEAVDMLLRCAIDSVYKLENVAVDFPDGLFLIVHALFIEGQYQKGIELGQHAIEWSIERNQSVIKLLFTVGLAKFHNGNYTAGLNDIEKAFISMELSEDQIFEEYWKGCFYLIPRLKYINPCFGHPIFYGIHSILKSTIYLLFVLPLEPDGSDYVLDLEPKSFFPELQTVHLSSSMGVMVSPLNPVASIQFTRFHKNVMQQLCVSVEETLRKVLVVFVMFKHPIPRFFINVSSVFIRLYVFTLILCFSLLFLLILVVCLFVILPALLIMKLHCEGFCLRIIVAIHSIVLFCLFHEYLQFITLTWYALEDAVAYVFCSLVYNSMLFLYFNFTTFAPLCNFCSRQCIGKCVIISCVSLVIIATAIDYCQN